MRKIDKIIILHGCPPNKESQTPRQNRWMNWLADKLVDLGYDAYAPDLPTPWQPVYEDWKNLLEEFSVTKNSVLVGHSCSGAFLVRWLSDKKMIVRKLILVAPAKIPETSDDTRQGLYQFELSPNMPKVADDMVLYTSNDFPHHLESLELYRLALPDARVIALEDKGHFLYYQMGTNEFPELVEAITSKE